LGTFLHSKAGSGQRAQAGHAGHLLPELQVPGDGHAGHTGGTI